MRSNWRFVLVAAIIGLLVVGLGCKKAPPDVPSENLTTTSRAEPEPEPAEDVSPAPRPDVEDRTPDPLDADIKTADVSARDRGLIGDVYFDFDKYDLKPEARERLAKNAEFLKEHTGFIVTIEGHADERGTNDYNIALGDRRSNAAKEYLVSLGITANRIRTVSYGEEQPVCTESSESCWSRNRRAEFHLSGRTS